MRLIRSALLSAALLLPTAAFADVSLDCSGGLCFATVSSPGSPTPFNYTWHWTYLDPFPHNTVIIPRPCDGKKNCTFQCPNGNENLEITFTAKDATSALIGTATSTMLCSGVVL